MFISYFFICIYSYFVGKGVEVHMYKQSLGPIWEKYNTAVGILVFPDNMQF